MTGILDEYPGAAAAYSLRLLNTDYTGDAVIVRRASDNATTNIGFVDGELDTDTLDTFCSGTNGFVATWYDQSGNGYNATQTTASDQPKIYDSINGVILENGKPAIDASNILIALRASFSSSTVMTGIAVSRITDGSSNRYITDSSSGRFIIGSFSGSGKYTAFRSAQLQGDNLDTSKVALHFAKFDGANSELTTNSGTTYTGDAGTSTFTEFRIAGGVVGFSGTVQEIIIYTNDQSSNRTGIEDNINNHYSIY